MRKVKVVRMTAVLVGAALAAALLAGCRDEEQGRHLVFQAGKYEGKPDTEPSDQARKSLRDRIATQNY
jgi:hypothetical protein